MRVSKIEYARLQSDGDYGHDRLSLAVDLEPDWAFLIPTNQVRISLESGSIAVHVQTSP